MDVDQSGYSSCNNGYSALGRPVQKSRHGMIDKELAEVEARLQQDCEEQDVFGFGFGVEAAGSSSPLARPSMPAQPDNVHQNITWAR